MVTDTAIKRLRQHMNKENNITKAAALAGVDRKTARKYLNLGKLPGELPTQMRYWRTRKDPFVEIWPDVAALLQDQPRFEAKALFEHLQTKYSGKFSEGQVRSFQRRVKQWRYISGPPQEVYFPQVYKPGERAQFDFTRMNKLEVTIAGQPFSHMIFHFVLCYSNWEWASVCFGESFENLSGGLQDALFQLGKKPEIVQSDSLSAAIHVDRNREQFTPRYMALMNHFELQCRNINVGKANENGKIEKRHDVFKRAFDQALMIRGSRDFSDRETYERFMRRILYQQNGKRQLRFQEEVAAMKTLTKSRLHAMTRDKNRVSSNSIISVRGNTYMVPSQLQGALVDVFIYPERIEVWYGQKKVIEHTRLSGKGKRAIRYQCVIDSLVKKPGAFENYLYHDDFFPTTNYRIIYDLLKKTKAGKGIAMYLQILKLAAYNGESAVENILTKMLGDAAEISPENVTQRLATPCEQVILQTQVDEVQLSDYDSLLSGALYG